MSGLKEVSDKLGKELKDISKAYGSIMEPCVEYLKKRCSEDSGMCEDVLQDGETLSKCCDYIMKKARESLGGKNGAIRDDVVYEWCEDYYRMDAKEEAKQLKDVKSVPVNGKKYVPKKEKEIPEQHKEEKPKEEPKPKKEAKPNGKTKKANKQQLPGQMSIFDFM